MVWGEERTSAEQESHLQILDGKTCGADFGLSSYTYRLRLCGKRKVGMGSIYNPLLGMLT